MTRRPTLPALTAITRRLAELSRAELRELASIIADLLSALDDPPPDQVTSAAPTAGTRPVGHIEEKWINGYGPYLYLRRWRGKTLTSSYIGKKPKGE